MSSRLIIIGAVLILGAAAALLAITQARSLAELQGTVTALYTTSTAQVDAANSQATEVVNLIVTQAAQAATAQSTALTQAAQSAATARSFALVGADATAVAVQRTAVQEAEETAATQAAFTLAAAEQSSATAQAEALTSIAVTQVTLIAQVQNNLATSSAATLDALQSDALAAQVEAVAVAQSEGATSVAQVVNTEATRSALARTQLEATQAALQANLAGAEATQNSLLSEMSDLQATQAGDAARLADAQTFIAQFIPTSMPTPTPTPASAAIPDGWRVFTGNELRLALPGSFVGGDLANEPQMLNDATLLLGRDFESVAALIAESPDALRFFAYDSLQLRRAGTLTQVEVIVEPLSSSDSLLSMDAVLENAVNLLPADASVRERNQVSLTRYPAGRLIVEWIADGLIRRQVHYFIVESSQVWRVIYTTPADNFERLLPIFEQSINTLEITSGA